MPEPLSYDEMMSALGEAIAKLGEGPHRRPRHPETGCPCKDCTERDNRLESLAEDRAAYRRGD